ELQKKRKYFIIPFILLISVNVCFSQYNFIPGYILSVKGDTLKGEVLDQGYILNSQSVTFRENENKKEQYYSPTDINAYYISNGNYYESKIFDYYQEIPARSLYLIVNTSKESENRLAYEVIRDTAFLRVIVKGKAKLYLLNNLNDRLMYFVETPSGGLKQLKKDKTYSARKNGSIKFKTKNTIKDTLLLLTSDCEEDLYFEKRSKIYLTDLIDLMMDYNSCIDSESEIIQPRQKIKPRFGVLFGVNRADLIIKGEGSHVLSSSYPLNPKMGYQFGLAFDWFRQT
ncbi:MAG: hypothetical protein K8R74_06130, partial [Bacteroidales bacterium]|nr:hypothetical protein [Bacteroidales bacterium]